MGVADQCSPMPDNSNVEFPTIVKVLMIIRGLIWRETTKQKPTANARATDKVAGDR